LLFNVTDRGARLSNTTLLHPDVFAPPEGSDSKEVRLENLGAPDAFDDLTWADVRTAFRMIADRAALVLAEARQDLKSGVPLCAASRLAAAFREKEFALLFGNYSLKLMPHLVRPERVEPDAWKTLIAECEQLVELARNLR
jgi:hypothetical protein